MGDEVPRTDRHVLHLSGRHAAASLGFSHAVAPGPQPIMCQPALLLMEWCTKKEANKKGQIAIILKSYCGEGREWLLLLNLCRRSLPWCRIDRGKGQDRNQSRTAANPPSACRDSSQPSHLSREKAPSNYFPAKAPTSPSGEGKNYLYHCYLH